MSQLSSQNSSHSVNTKLYRPNFSDHWQFYKTEPKNEVVGNENSCDKLLANACDTSKSPLILSYCCNTRSGMRRPSGANDTFSCGKTKTRPATFRSASRGCQLVLLWLVKYSFINWNTVVNEESVNIELKGLPVRRKLTPPVGSCSLSSLNYHDRPYLILNWYVESQTWRPTIRWNRLLKLCD